jgi:hypothetical protein
VTRDREMDSELRPKGVVSTIKTDRVGPWPLGAAVATRFGDPRQSPRTHWEEALCHQRVVQMTGLTKIRRVARRSVTRLACHTISGVEEVSWARGRGVLGTETPYHRGRWYGGQMLGSAGDQKRISKGQASATGGGLKADVHILAAS